MSFFGTMSAGPRRFHLKRNGDEREALILVALSHHEPDPPVNLVAPNAVGRPIRRIRAPAARASITRDIAVAVAFGDMHGVRLVVHPALILLTSHGVVCEVGEAPDARFCPPEQGLTRGLTREAPWAIGCVLHKLVTGRAPVTIRDAERGTEARAIVRCLGAPTMSESRALGIPVTQSTRTRARVRGATETERLILRSTLAWVPSARMICTTRGLVSSMPTLHESRGGGV